MVLPFHLEACTVDGQQVLTVSGEIDTAVADLFEHALLAAVAATPPGGVLALDMEKVDFFGSCAARTLVLAAAAAAAGGTGLLVTASRVVRRVLEIVCVDSASFPALSLVESPEPAADRRDVAPRIRRDWRVNLSAAARQTRRPGGHAGTAPG
jgi:anti-anti-sigma factor